MKYETYYKLVLATGLRRGEACGLKWSDINWKKRTIHIQRGVVKLSHEESITKDPKTASGDRIVYLSKEMCQLLKSWRKECEWDRKQTADETVSEDDYLFRQTNGKPIVDTLRMRNCSALLVVPREHAALKLWIENSRIYCGLTRTTRHFK